MLLVRILLLVAVLLPATAMPGTGQQPPPSQPPAGWDTPRALELMARARERRLAPAQDTALRNYTAEAEGFVYFYLDRLDTEDRTLVKVDQVALELYWQSPGVSRQRIVGLRDQSRLPNTMHYHLDHLTVVQNGFGDLIRMGDGDEVRDVPHPAAPGSDSIYWFRLTDSLTLQLPGLAQPIRVYELEVRPHRMDRPAFVGSVFVDRGTADIVRMTFTFTPVSYVDDRLDYINVSLDNGLWEGRYWLPNEQTLQIRRQLPELDFAAGAIIHGRMRIGGYTFNDSIAPAVFTGPTLTAAPEAELTEFPFERGILDDLNEAGLAAPTDLADIRRQAAELLGTNRLTGLPRLRPYLASASSALRFNRAEGLSLGAGAAYTPGPAWRLEAAAGYAFGANHPRGSLSVRQATGEEGDATFRLVYNDAVDLGLRPALPTALNTLSATFLSRDYTDIHYSSGGSLTVRHEFESGLRGELELAAHRHRSARLTQESGPITEARAFAAVRPVDEGDVSTLSAAIRRLSPDPRASQWGGAAHLEVGAYAGEYYLRPTVTAVLRRFSADQSRGVTVTADAGLVTYRAPSQRLFLLGGQNTLPGYGHRLFAGTRFALVNIAATAHVLEPWLGLRLIGAAGSIGGRLTPRHGIDDTSEETLPTQEPAAWARWNAPPAAGIVTSAGAGLSLFWDVLRIDAVRGLKGGEWRLHIGIHPDFDDIL